MSLNLKYRHKTLENAHGTFRNGQKRSCKRSGNVNAERSGTPRNVRVWTQQRFGMNGVKRSRCVHVHVSKTKETLYITYIFRLSIQLKLTDQPTHYLGILQSIIYWFTISAVIKKQFDSYKYNILCLNEFLVCPGFSRVFS